jgi:hypothetical protein
LNHLRTGDAEQARGWGIGAGGKRSAAAAEITLSRCPSWPNAQCGTSEDLRRRPRGRRARRTTAPAKTEVRSEAAKLTQIPSSVVGSWQRGLASDARGRRPQRC